MIGTSTLPAISKCRPLVITASDRSLTGCDAGTDAASAARAVSFSFKKLTVTPSGKAARPAMSKTPLLKDRVTAFSGNSAEMAAVPAAATAEAGRRSIFSTLAKRVNRHCSTRLCGQPVSCQRVNAPARTPVNPASWSKLGCIVDADITRLLYFKCEFFTASAADFATGQNMNIVRHNMV